MSLFYSNSRPAQRTRFVLSSRPWGLAAAIRTAAFFAVLAVLVGGLAGCSKFGTGSPKGKYVSSEDQGVIVFRDDGVFGFKFGTMVDSYDESRLPPNQGTFYVDPTGILVIKVYDRKEPRFRLDWHPYTDSVDVIRLQVNGDLPPISHYEKRSQ
jgi:hypothetical protein